MRTEWTPEQVSPVEPTVWSLRLPNGLLVMVGQYDVEFGSQLYVSINTEELGRDNHDDDGCPLLNVEINGGSVYDRERKSE